MVSQMQSEAGVAGGRSWSLTTDPRKVKSDGNRPYRSSELDVVGGKLSASVQERAEADTEEPHVRYN